METNNQISPMNEPLWTAEEVAAYLKISLSMVYKLRRTARLPSIPIGACYRFNPEIVRAFGRGEPVVAKSAKVFSLR